MEISNTDKEKPEPDRAGGPDDTRGSGGPETPESERKENTSDTRNEEQTVWR